MKIHLDTTLLIQRPRWELLPAGDHRIFVSAISFAEFAEGTSHPDPAIAARAALELIELRDVYGTGVPFGQHEADVYRELCAVLSRSGRAVGGRRRIDVMIAAVAVADNAALATRNSGDFSGLESVLRVLEL